MSGRLSERFTLWERVRMVFSAGGPLTCGCWWDIFNGYRINRDCVKHQAPTYRLGD